METVAIMILATFVAAAIASGATKPERQQVVYIRADAQDYPEEQEDTGDGLSWLFFLITVGLLIWFSQ